MKYLLCVISLCLITSSAIAQEVDVYTPPALATPHKAYHWVARDSNALWSHVPDTGLVQITMKPYGSFSGHIISRDSNWVVLLTSNGLKQEVRTSMVRQVYDQVESTDTVSLVGRPQLMRPQRRQRFESYLAPTALIGTTFPNGGASGVFAWSLGAFYGFRIPHVLYHYLGGFVSAQVESKTFMYSEGTGGTDYWSVRYLSATAGFSYRGLITLGMTIGLPYPGATQRTFFTGQDDPNSLYFAQRYAVTTNLVRTNFEPHLVIGIPLTYTFDERAFMLLIDGGYPLTTALRDYLPQDQFPKLGDIRLPEIRAGFSYVFPLFRRFGPDFSY